MFVKSAEVVSPPTESHSAKLGAKRRRRESGFTTIWLKSKSAPPLAKILNLYFFGLFEVRPSGSVPFHEIRNDGPNVGGSR